MSAYYSIYFDTSGLISHLIDHVTSTSELGNNGMHSGEDSSPTQLMLPSRQDVSKLGVYVPQTMDTGWQLGVATETLLTLCLYTEEVQLD